MRLLELFENTLYQVPGEDVGYHAMAYWYNPVTKKALPVTRGFDQGHDEGDHHVDVMIKNPKEFGLDTPDMQKMIAGGDFDTTSAVAYGTYWGWCRVSLGNQVDNHNSIRATIDASDKKKAAACLRWLLDMYPNIAVCEINLVTWKPEWAYKKQPTQNYTELTGKQIEAFARTGNVIRLREGKVISLDNSPHGSRVTENPTPQQMMSIINSNPFREIRFMISPSVMYAWDSRLAIHNDMHQLLIKDYGLDPDIQFETGILTFINEGFYLWHLNGHTEGSLRQVESARSEYQQMLSNPFLKRSLRAFNVEIGPPNLHLDIDDLSEIGWSDEEFAPHQYA